MTIARQKLPHLKKYKLQDLAMNVLGRSVDKSMQLSNWSRADSLSTDQELYAAADVALPCMIHRKMSVTGAICPSPVTSYLPQFQFSQQRNLHQPPPVRWEDVALTSVNGVAGCVSLCVVVAGVVLTLVVVGGGVSALVVVDDVSKLESELESKSASTWSSHLDHSFLWRQCWAQPRCIPSGGAACVSHNVVVTVVLLISAATFGQAVVLVLLSAADCLAALSLFALPWCKW